MPIAERQPEMLANAYASNAPSMTVTAERGGVEVIERWADDWRALCNESPDDQPFFRPEWIAAHIRAFTPQAKVVLLTVQSEGKLLFVLPLLHEWTMFSGIPLRTLRAPVNSHSCRFDAVRHSGRLGDAAVSAAWNYLQNSSDWDLLHVEDVLDQSAISALADAARKNGLHAIQVPNRRNPYVPIPADPADLNKLPVNKKLRSQLRQKRRELEAKGTLRLHRASTADPSLLSRFYQLESSGWKGEEGSAIACDPQIRQFYDEIAQSAERFGYLCMYSLELNGELLASHLGLSHRGRYFSPKIAYSSKFREYAPGHMIVSEILLDCAARGISEYDITGINDDWKMKWTTETRPKFIYFIFRRGLLPNLAHSVRFRWRPAAKKIVQAVRHGNGAEESSSKDS